MDKECVCEGLPVCTTVIWTNLISASRHIVHSEDVHAFVRPNRLNVSSTGLLSPSPLSPAHVIPLTPGYDQESAGFLFMPFLVNTQHSLHIWLPKCYFFMCGLHIMPNMRICSFVHLCLSVRWLKCLFLWFNNSNYHFVEERIDCLSVSGWCGQSSLCFCRYYLSAHTHLHTFGGWQVGQLGD